MHLTTERFGRYKAPYKMEGYSVNHNDAIKDHIVSIKLPDEFCLKEEKDIYKKACEIFNEERGENPDSVSVAPFPRFLPYHILGLTKKPLPDKPARASFKERR